MAATGNYVSIVSPSPSWTLLSTRFRDRCQDGVPSDPSVLDLTIIQQRNNTYRPHTFCPVSARCEHIPLVLSGITRFSPTRQSPAMPSTMYLSSFTSATVQGTYCFGHINVPKKEWDRRQEKKFHVTLYTRVYDAFHGCYILQESHKLYCYVQKQQFFRGPQQNQTFWMVFPDGARAQPITHNGPVMACFETFARAFEIFLDAEFP